MTKYVIEGNFRTQYILQLTVEAQTESELKKMLKKIIAEKIKSFSYVYTDASKITHGFDSIRSINIL